VAAKLIFLVGLLGIGGYVGHKLTSFDPTVFPYSEAQVRSMLVDAKTVLPRRDGPGEIKIWSDGGTSKGVALSMRYASWSPLINCQAIITPISGEESRVVPDCGSSADSGSAISRTEHQLRTPMFEEHIQATLNKRSFNRATVDSKESAAVFQNLGGMQREALKTADEMQAMTAR
jgi:hypothetical protein